MIHVRSADHHEERKSIREGKIEGKITASIFLLFLTDLTDTFAQQQ